MHARSAREINQCYRTLRPRLLMCMIIGYAAFYLTRKSVNYVLPALQTDLGLDKGDIGLLGSLFYLSYGLSKFTAGLWHDSHGQRGFMGIGLFRHWAIERGVCLWRITYASACGLDTERIFSRLGVVTVCPLTDPLVFP
ncbi:major Facilitator Superfamily protein [Escherichia coli 4-203-08_S1_C3]|nr:major Facilitator Superfamily protein [Escherichia coli 4-203-08_S1_C3]